LGKKKHYGRIHQKSRMAPLQAKLKKRKKKKKRKTKGEGLVNEILGGSAKSYLGSHRGIRLRSYESQEGRGKKPNECRPGDSDVYKNLSNLRARLNPDNRKAKWCNNKISQAGNEIRRRG